MATILYIDIITDNDTVIIIMLSAPDMVDFKVTMKLK